jgi:hypothetical protein
MVDTGRIEDRAAAFHRRLAASGLRVLPADPQAPGPHHELDEGEGPDAAAAALDALMAERNDR